MAVRTLLGMETEYAVGGTTADGRAIEPRILAEEMLSVARRNYPHLRDSSGKGMFLASGARLYVDIGGHPEFATPECEDPWEVLRYVRAGEGLLCDLTRWIRPGSLPLREVNVLRANVDYSRSGTTWGCHESYLHRSPPADLPAQLIPHLVSRVIYTGAGGFNPVGPGLEFTVSPRAWLIQHAQSSNSTAERGIYHLKDESLSAPGWHRLHVICGENLCSDTATLLKLGATALVLAAVDAGRRPGDAVSMTDPVGSLRVFAGDPEGRATVPLTDNRTARAIDIQRHYLAQVEACRDDGHLPEWAGEICRLWRKQLDALETADRSLDRTLDWAIKRMVYRGWAARQGMDWDRLPRWNAVLRQLERTAERMLLRDGPVIAEAMLGANSPFLRQIDRLTPVLTAQGWNWTDMHELLRLRYRLLEADLRFAKLGESGVFNQLDRRGLLAHRVVELADWGELVSQPPSRGRARLRGEWVRRLSSHASAEQYHCDWGCLYHETTGRYLDLSDPFKERGEWSVPGSFSIE